MNIRIPYGSTYLSVDLPESTTVISPRYRSALTDERGAFMSALHTPLASAAAAFGE